MPFGEVKVTRDGDKDGVSDSVCENSKSTSSSPISNHDATTKTTQPYRPSYQFRLVLVSPRIVFVSNSSSSSHD
eukprot:8300641-Ditylum_brightwellii.AAC.1